METSRPIIVKRVPESLNIKYARDFLEEVRPLLEHDRPQLVFDLSLVRKIDSAGVDMLLHCMKEAARRDGDLKLASLSPQAQVVLELTRTGRLFEIFATSVEAVRSFSGYLPNMVRQFYPETELDLDGEGGRKAA
jgi:anti-sigma B factor antagonist